jgi:hypothetical protein
MQSDSKPTRNDGKTIAKRREFAWVKVTVGHVRNARTEAKKSLIALGKMCTILVVIIPVRYRCQRQR